MFDPVTIVNLLAAGAMMKLSDVGGQVVLDAYQGLKSALVKGFNFTAGELLEKKPKDGAIRNAAAEDISPEALKDKTVIEAAKKLQAALTTAGVTIESLSAQGNIELGKVSAGGQGVMIRDVNAGKDIKIGDVTG